MNVQLTKEEAERGYAGRSGMTYEKFKELGGYASPCNCDYEHCMGWKIDFPDKK